MNEDDVKKVRECFERRSGAKVPPPRRSTRNSAQASSEDEHPSDGPGQTEGNGSGPDFRAGAQGMDDSGQPVGKIVSLDSVFGDADTVNPPTLPDVALYGVCGSIVRKLAPHTEAHPAAIYFQLLTIMANVFGRKGTAFGHACSFADEADPDWRNSCVRTSMTSGEGLVREMSDDTGRDRRCLLYFTEYANVLNAAKWTGSNITGVIREAWDSGTLYNMAIKNRSKNNKFLQASNCHISIVGHITQEELIRLIPEDADANGFANRFLHVYAHRTKILPDGEGLYEVDFSREREDIIEAIWFARQRGRMVRSPEATGLWCEIYPSLTRDIPGRMGKLLSRAAPHVVRLSLILALLDRSAQVEVPQLDAAYRLWQYCEQSTLWAYSPWRYSRIAQHVLGALRHDGPQTMTQIANDVLRKNHTSAEIRRAIEEIKDRVVIVELPGKRRPVNQVSLR